MPRKLPAVKQPRGYDSSKRVARAVATRAAVVAAARARFLTEGFANTTVAAVADDVGVSVESIYKSFGGKSGMLRAVYQSALAGAGGAHAEVRSDAMAERSIRARDIIAGWMVLMAEVMPRVAPILLLVRDAGKSDADAALLHRELNEARLSRMQANARALMRARGVRAGLSAANIADVLWLYSGAELYELLVVERQWSVSRMTSFVGAAMVAALVDDHRVAPQ